MKTRFPLLSLTFLAASLSQAGTLVCSVNGGMVELCNASGFQVSLDLTESGVAIDDLENWASRQFTLPDTQKSLFLQSISFSGLKPAPGAPLSMGWGVVNPSSPAGALGSVMDGQIGVLGVLSGGFSGISGRLRLAEDATGTHSFAIGVIQGTSYSVPMEALMPLMPAPSTPFQSLPQVDPPMLSDVPEPSTFALTSALLLALAALGGRHRASL